MCVWQGQHLFSVDADQDMIALCAVDVVHAAQTINKYRAHPAKADSENINKNNETILRAMLGAYGAQDRDLGCSGSRVWIFGHQITVPCSEVRRASLKKKRKKKTSGQEKKNVQTGAC